MSLRNGTIILLKEYDLSSFYGKLVHFFFVKVDDYRYDAAEMVENISSVSWLNKLDKYSEAAYRKTVQRTVEALVKIFSDASLSPENESINDEFGEYLISVESADVLKTKDNHMILPLAELWKEKRSGNHGFDFHTVSQSQLISFGEAKYRAGNNGYQDAIDQILEFIKDEKDLNDITHLRSLKVSDYSVDKLLGGKRCFAAGFSFPAMGKNQKRNYNQWKNNICNNCKFKELIKIAEELYVVGFEIC